MQVFVLFSLVASTFFQIAGLVPCGYVQALLSNKSAIYFAACGLSHCWDMKTIDQVERIEWFIPWQALIQARNDINNSQCFTLIFQRSGGHGSTAATAVSNKNCSHLASTYCALAILKMVGYNLSNINPEAILKSMRKLQQHDGSFVPIHFRAETDLRFVYCAAAICSMLDNWTGMDKEKAKEYIVRCQSYDGGFGLVPDSESHGGATFCAVAALQLMGFIGEDISPNQEVIDMPLLVEWLLQSAARQSGDGGFQGRMNKPSDTCYAFWVGGVLKMLGLFEFINKDALRNFILSCQSKYGGFTKFPGMKFPDLYHSYYSFSALSLLGEPGFRSLYVELGICSDCNG
ncbi:hypothetical protein ZIOFF_057851 [Zingiber officinale]|uniref:Prenyltransferase alpha-alpha toroid domain-containing protein n=1 Tax=Zingiber officinale TaxID=94328 RepID=A0A8J5F5K7_ZINOF|nr:hypothetical protein ZIOFF_057851 [Zingiber officinale]